MEASDFNAMPTLVRESSASPSAYRRQVHPTATRPKGRDTPTARIHEPSPIHETELILEEEVIQMSDLSLKRANSGEESDGPASKRSRSNSTEVSDDTEQDEDTVEELVDEAPTHRTRRRSAIKAAGVIRRKAHGDFGSGDDNEDDHVCMACNMNVATNDLLSHAKSHFSGLQCKMCSYSSDNSRGMRGHIRQKHGHEVMHMFEERDSTTSVREMLINCYRIAEDKISELVEETEKSRRTTREASNTSSTASAASTVTAKVEKTNGIAPVTVQEGKFASVLTLFKNSHKYKSPSDYVRCKECTSRIQSRNVQSHIFWHCKGDYGVPYKCSECDQTNSRQKEMIDHIRRTHRGRGSVLDVTTDKMFARSVRWAVLCFPTFADGFADSEAEVRRIEKKYGMKPIKSATQKPPPQPPVAPVAPAKPIFSNRPMIKEVKAPKEYHFEEAEQLDYLPPPLTLSLPAEDPVKWLRARLETSVTWKGWNDKHQCKKCQVVSPAGHINKHVQLHASRLRFSCTYHRETCTFSTEDPESADAHRIKTYGHRCEDTLDAGLFSEWIALVPYCFPSFKDVFPRTTLDWVQLKESLDTSNKVEEVVVLPSETTTNSAGTVLVNSCALTPPSDSQEQPKEINAPLPSVKLPEASKTTPLPSDPVRWLLNKLEQSASWRAWTDKHQCSICSLLVPSGQFVRHIERHASRLQYACGGCEFSTSFLESSVSHAAENLGHECTDKLDDTLFAEWCGLISFCFPAFKDVFPSTPLKWDTLKQVAPVIQTPVENALIIDADDDDMDDDDEMSTMSSGPPSPVGDSSNDKTIIPVSPIYNPYADIPASNAVPLPSSMASPESTSSSRASSNSPDSSAVSTVTATTLPLPPAPQNVFSQKSVQRDPALHLPPQNSTADAASIIQSLGPLGKQIQEAFVKLNAQKLPGMSSLLPNSAPATNPAPMAPVPPAHAMSLPSVPQMPAGMAGLGGFQNLFPKVRTRSQSVETLSSIVQVLEMAKRQQENLLLSEENQPNPDIDFASYTIPESRVRTADLIPRFAAALRRDWEKSSVFVHERCKLCNDECLMTRESVSEMIMHAKLHSSRPNFKCSVCSRLGYSATDLEEHIKTAHGRIADDARILDTRDELLEFEWLLLCNFCFPAHMRSISKSVLLGRYMVFLRDLSLVEVHNARRNREIAKCAGNDFFLPPLPQRPIESRKCFAAANTQPYPHLSNPQRSKSLYPSSSTPAPSDSLISSEKALADARRVLSAASAKSPALAATGFVDVRQLIDNAMMRSRLPAPTLPLSGSMPPAAYPTSSLPTQQLNLPQGQTKVAAASNAQQNPEQSRYISL